jgi:hypothetical protein
MATERKRITKTQEVHRPYKKLDHGWISEIADVLAQQARAEMLKQGVPESAIKFGVTLQMRFTEGGPSIEVEAATFDPSFDWDKECQEAMDSPLTGYAKFSLMPGDVAFRIAGKSQGYFNGGWILYRFLERYKTTGGGIALDSPTLIEAVTINAWAVSQVRWPAHLMALSKAIARYFE